MQDQVKLTNSIYLSTMCRSQIDIPTHLNYQMTETSLDITKKRRMVLIGLIILQNHQQIANTTFFLLQSLKCAHIRQQIYEAQQINFLSCYKHCYVTGATSLYLDKRCGISVKSSIASRSPLQMRQNCKKKNLRKR